jgi:hypothetical protein
MAADASHRTIRCSTSSHATGAEALTLSFGARTRATLVMECRDTTGTRLRRWRNSRKPWRAAGNGNRRPDLPSRRHSACPADSKNQRKQDDDGNGYAEKKQQKRAHDGLR